MSQIHPRTNVLVDFEVSRYEGEGTHVVTRSPWSGVRLCAVDGVVAELVESLFEDVEVEVRQTGDGRFVERFVRIKRGLLKSICEM